MYNFVWNSASNSWAGWIYYVHVSISASVGVRCVRRWWRIFMPTAAIHVPKYFCVDCLFGSRTKLACIIHTYVPRWNVADTTHTRRHLASCRQPAYRRECSRFSRTIRYSRYSENNRNVNKWVNSHYADRGANEITISSYCWMCQLISPLASLARLDVNWMPPVTLSPSSPHLSHSIHAVCLILIIAGAPLLCERKECRWTHLYLYKFRVHCVSARFYFVCTAAQRTYT